MSFAHLVTAYALRISPERPGTGGFAAAEADARDVVRAALIALADVLPEQLAAALLGLVPGALRVVEPARADDDAGRFASRVAEQLNLPLQAALERAQVALAVLGAGLEPELRARVARELPATLRAHFERDPAAPAPTRLADGRGHTLADGRPGSDRSLAEADRKR